MSDEISLFALMDSHLSRTKLDDERNNPTRSASEMLLPATSGSKLVIPNFFPGNSPMKDFLAQQIANTLKAKEKRKQEEEQRKIEEEMKRLKIKDQQLNTEDSTMNCDEEEYIIDLTAAIIRQPVANETTVQHLVPDEPAIKSQGGKPKHRNLGDSPKRWDNQTFLYKVWDPNLPCTTDASYILKQKVRRGKCSNFAKVLCARVKPAHGVSIASPMKTEKFETKIVRFDFKTKSPCALAKEKEKWKPKLSTRWTVDITDFEV